MSKQSEFLFEAGGEVAVPPDPPDPVVDNSHPDPVFDGPDLNADDVVRLSGQLSRVWEVMESGDFLTLQEIAQRIFDRFQVDDSQAGISARIRDFRKPRFGSNFVNKRRRGGSGGTWEYQLRVRQS